MRKVLSFVLVLSLVLGSFGMVFAAPLSDIAGEDFEDAVNVLTELGVVKGYPDGTFKPGNIVTRAEMAVIVVNALGLADYAVGTANFSDMAGHWSNPFVAYATSLGILSGYPDGTFKPDKTVSYDEAAKMLVAALGYTPESLVGTWPANYVTRAKTLGILDGIKAGVAGANRGDIATMTYQTLNKLIGKTNKDGDWTANIPADNMLTRLDAKLYAPATAYKTAEDGVAGAAFVVTGDEDSIISLRELQGALVTAYANDDDEIIAIKEVKSVFFTGEFDDVVAAGTIDGTDKFGDYKVKAAAIPAAGTTETYSFVNGADAAAEIAVAAVVDGDDYTIACEISGNYITKIYSIASWDITVGASGEAQIDEDDLDDIADGELLTMDFPKNNKDKPDYDEFALFGVKSLEEIEKDDVVTVYDDGTGDIARVEVGKEVVKGVVSRITSGDTKATIGGKVYKISGNAVSPNFATFGVKAGDEVELYLNYAGKIYDLEKIEGGDDMLAIVVNYEVGVPAKMSDGDSQIKLFLADGTTKTFTVDDDDLTNAAVVAKFDAGAGFGGGGAVAPGAGIISVGSVVEYSLDKDGLLNGIALADATGFDNTGTVDVTSKGTYKGIYIASDATIFTTTDDSGTINFNDDDTEIIGTDDDDWGVTTLAKLVGTKDVDAFYSVDATSKKIEWMVIVGGTTDEDIFAVYNDYDVVDSDAGYEVHVLVDGVATNYEADSLAKAANPGAPGALDIYKLALTTDGLVSKWTAVVTGGDYTRTVEAYAAGNKVKNNVASLPGGDYALSTDVVVYTWSAADAEWSKASTSALTDDDYAAIILYDIDADLIYDYILVQ